MSFDKHKNELSNEKGERLTENSHISVSTDGVAQVTAASRSSVSSSQAEVVVFHAEATES